MERISSQSRRASDSVVSRLHLAFCRWCGASGLMTLCRLEKSILWFWGSPLGSGPSLNSWTAWGATGFGWIKNIMSMRCSIGFCSGEHWGQSMVSMPSSSRNYLHNLTTWVRALSSTRRNPGPTAPVWQQVQGFHPDTWRLSECCCELCRSLCPPMICFSRPSLTHHRTCHAQQC